MRGNWLKIAGLLAAVALAVRGILDLREGHSPALLLVAAVILAAVALRHFRFRA
ncbi:MAG TPA: hypothetical protein VFU47_11460 [Armatimonadota bacterium]|nr:hypothetical protein [Armatimonadota bacterium]